VFKDVLRAGPATLFPLQGALGYDIAQTLFVGPNCLIVEGVSDLLYLQTMTGVLEEKGRRGLDRRWTITPVGGSEKVPTFAALLGAQKGLTVATLLDFQKKDQQRIEALYERQLLERSHVLTFAEFTGADEADIEDMFDLGFFLKLVNGEYGGEASKKPTDKDVKKGHPRVLVRLEQFFKANPLTGPAEFGHFRPAKHFAENIGTLKKALAASTLERFEKMFIKINALLP
jgi:hypothetical protein